MMTAYQGSNTEPLGKIPFKPVGPGNNLAGIPTTTSPTAPPALGRRQQRDLTIATLLGQAAQAVEPTGIGARLGAFGVQYAGQQRFQNALARSLAGEELGEAELQGLGPEQVNQIMTLSEQADRRKAEKAKREEAAKAAKLDQYGKSIDILRTAAESGWSDEQLQGLAGELGINTEGVDFQSATERQKELLGEESKLRISELKVRTTEEQALLVRKLFNELQSISARGAQEIKAIQARVGDNPAQLAQYGMALETVTTYFKSLGPDAVVEPSDVSIVFEDALRAVGGNEILTRMRATAGPMYKRYLGEDEETSSANPPGTAPSQEELTRAYGPPKAGNPYTPSDPVQLIGYGMYQQGMTQTEIVPVLMRLQLRSRMRAAADSSARATAASTSNPTPTRRQ